MASSEGANASRHPQAPPWDTVPLPASLDDAALTGSHHAGVDPEEHAQHNAQHDAESAVAGSGFGVRIQGGRRGAPNPAAAGGAAVPPVAVGGPEQVIDSSKAPLDALEDALDWMCVSNRAFLGQYVVLGSVERRRGGQGVVQFMRRCVASPVSCQFRVFYTA